MPKARLFNRGEGVVATEQRRGLPVASIVVDDQAIRWLPVKGTLPMITIIAVQKSLFQETFRVSETLKV